MRSMILAGCVVVSAGLGCAGLQGLGFGPYPTSSIGGSNLAGVAGFVAGTTPGPGEFRLIVFNTDSTNSYSVTVTPKGGTTDTKEALPCSGATFITDCTATEVTVALVLTGTNTQVSLKVTPTATCSEQLVFIATSLATTTTTTGTTGTTTTTPTLTQATPTSLVNCYTSGT